MSQLVSPIVRRLRRQIRRLENASNNLAFIGATRPEDHPVIKLEYRLAKRRISDTLNELDTMVDWILGSPK